jgi:DNA adenine methylase
VHYMGGKVRIARHIENTILEHRGGRQNYLEPFLGGASVLARMAGHFDAVTASDVVPDLPLFWSEVQSGWVPPTRFTPEQWRELKTAEPSALRAFAGFGLSFGGKWFSSYVRDDDRTIQAATTSRSSVRKAAGFPDAQLLVRDYREWHPGPGTVVYCDPPYAGVTGYPAAEAATGHPWDPDEFWQVATQWSIAGAQVFVSERPDAPLVAGWVPVWSGTKRVTMAADANDTIAGEVVYLYRP